MPKYNLTTPPPDSALRETGFSFLGKTIRFAVDNPADAIQSCHLNGCFYEARELADMTLLLPEEANILDLGANVGNHAIYFSLIERANNIVVFEPNPRAMRLLKKNIALNNLEDIVDLSHLGIALGKKDGRATYVEDQEKADNNLGGAQLESIHSSNESGILVKALDSIALPEIPDFIKIDVEGMEIDVLQGATNLILNNRPILYVEVVTSNREDFYKIMEKWNYRIERTYQRYRGLFNFLCVPW